LDSVGKKVRFLRQVRRVLQLDNIHPVQQRLEAFRHDGGFDTVVSRAFSSLTEFATLARHLLRPDSRLLAMKGRLPTDEIAALPAWLRVDAVEQLSVPGLQEQRHLVMMSTHRVTSRVE
jgi:16S rRNA (guanine527-N7)-methyltransferase